MDSMRDYLHTLNTKCGETMEMTIVMKKTDDTTNTIPTINTYNRLLEYKYNLAQLKSFAKHYKLKITGNKHELISRIYCFLHLSSHIIKIQKIFRKFIVLKYKSVRGPAAMERTLCTNANDFITLEPIEEINFHQFISYKDIDGFIYGFDISSLHNLFLKSEDKIKNPYNRNLIPDIIFKHIRYIIRLSKLFNIPINLKFEDDTHNVSNNKAIELKAIKLFQQIDSLGNYSNANWFLSLNRNQLIKFTRELIDIWQYRAQLLPQTKRDVCPPSGNPFANLNTEYINSETNVWNVKKILLDTIDKLVNTGIDKDNKALGAYYVLSALTLVSQDAAESLPWLYQSVNYI